MRIYKNDFQPFYEGMYSWASENGHALWEHKDIRVGHDWIKMDNQVCL